MIFERSSGIILHPTSLPGRYGIGSFNQAAYDWVDTLVETGQSLWQVLPLGPTGFGDSPYQSFSTFGGNPYLISLEDLVRDGLLDQIVLDAAPEFPRDRVNYGVIYRWKLPILRRVADTFAQRASLDLQAEFADFCAAQSEWLDDFALFMAIKESVGGGAWNTWEMDLRSRKKRTLARFIQEHPADIQAHKFSQWLFFRQWLALKAYANQRGVRIIGDIPIYVAMDSADAWANPKNFFFDDEFQPTVVAGVPPDYFSETGQLWGNPIYRWSYMKRTNYRWWIDRIKAALRLYDIVRVDHFRGFAGYWEVPAEEETAINGSWQKGPGASLFEAVQAELGELPIIAEDLGEITPDVIELRDRFLLPGMKILQFAFSTDASDKFLPHNYSQHFVVYTGTHDNDTSWGWYQVSSTPEEQDYFRRYLRTDGHDVPWTLIDAAFRSVAVMALTPLQDVLGLGTVCRMNLPGRAEGNWQWRFAPEQLTGHITQRLREITTIYGRDPQIYTDKSAEAGGI